MKKGGRRNKKSGTEKMLFIHRLLTAGREKL